MALHNIYEPLSTTYPRAVCCVLTHPSTGLVLGVSRGRGSNQWALVGGKVEPGEWLEEAMVRETREETGLEVFNLRRVYTDFSPGGERDFLTTAFTADWRGTPRSSEEGDVEWVSWDKVLTGPFGAYHFKLLQRLVSGVP